jgi:hypothetical protein
MIGDYAMGLSSVQLRPTPRRMSPEGSTAKPHRPLEKVILYIRARHLPKASRTNCACVCATSAAATATRRDASTRKQPLLCSGALILKATGSHRFRLPHKHAIWHLFAAALLHPRPSMHSTLNAKDRHNCFTDRGLRLAPLYGPPTLLTLLPLFLRQIRSCQTDNITANAVPATAQLTTTLCGQGLVYSPLPNFTAIIVSKLNICRTTSTGQQGTLLGARFGTWCGAVHEV